MSRDKGRWKIEQHFVVVTVVQFWEFSAEFSLQSSQKMMMLVGGAGMLSSSCVRVVSIEREKRKKETEGKRET